MVNYYTALIGSRRLIIIRLFVYFIIPSWKGVSENRGGVLGFKNRLVSFRSNDGRNVTNFEELFLFFVNESTNFSVSECRIMEFVSSRAREKYAGAPRILDYFSSLLVDLARIN